MLVTNLIHRKLLTQQQHYDWGLRALKTVLKGCGKVLKAKQKSVKINSDTKTMNKSEEIEVAVQALQLNMSSKLTNDDSMRFEILIKDIFPEVEFRDTGHEELVAALTESFIELKLQPIDKQVIIFYSLS